MNLHKDPSAFHDTLLAVADHWGTSPAIVEKDYFVTMLLESLARRIPNMIFKGGTSLSKCYKIIKRFSEDIDLTLDPENQKQGNKKNLKREIVDACHELGLLLTNAEEIRSRRDYNRYEIEYPLHFEGAGIKQHLLLETVFSVKAYPDETKFASSMIYDFWKEIGDEQAIREYEMEPFLIRVQTLERTFVDKVFALCDYAISNNTVGYSRHIYDLYRLLDVVNLDDNLKILAKEVRKDRRDSPRCYSAQDQYDIPKLLERIIDEKIFFHDYEKITRRVLFDSVSYESAIVCLQRIIDSRVFEK